MKTIIFDMDGTLIDSANAICITINEMRNRLGFAQNLEKKYIINVINDPNKNAIFEFYGFEKPDKNLKIEFESEFVKNYNKYAVLYDGVDKLIESCKEMDYFIALASNAPSATLSAILEKNKILKYFDIIVGVDGQTPPKPNPAMLFNVIKEAKNEKNIFIGDSAKDEQAALNANIVYLNVVWGFGKRSTKNLNVTTPQQAWEFIASM